MRTRVWTHFPIAAELLRRNNDTLDVSLNALSPISSQEQSTRLFMPRSVTSIPVCMYWVGDFHETDLQREPEECIDANVADIQTVAPRRVAKRKTASENNKARRRCLY